MFDIMELLLKAGKKNDVIHGKLTLKKAEKAIETERIEDPNATLKKVRDAILGLGKILEENTKENYYLSTIRVNATAAILVVRVSEGVVDIAAYAEEGIIKQHLAKKAIEMVVNRYKSLKGGAETDSQKEAECRSQTPCVKAEECKERLSEGVTDPEQITQPGIQSEKPKV